MRRVAVGPGWGLRKSFCWRIDEVVRISFQRWQTRETLMRRSCGETRVRMRSARTLPSKVLVGAGTSSSSAAGGGFSSSASWRGSLRGGGMLFFSFFFFCFFSLLLLLLLLLFFLSLPSKTTSRESESLFAASPISSAQRIRFGVLDNCRGGGGGGGGGEGGGGEEDDRSAIASAR